ncbi:hypothetical protein ACFVAJ_17240 [Agromyces sp. NPDC057679]|uniref:hypothetical protein n=1 Tax=Agromyces sp. NPDC057679 TaxID=3346207 RepID=UPI00367339F3
MAEEDDYAFEGYVEGSVFVCRAAECVAEQEEADARYWANFDVEAMRQAFEEHDDREEDRMHVKIGDIVRLRGGRARWKVIDVIGDRAYLESGDKHTEPPARLADLTVIESAEPDDHA